MSDVVDVFNFMDDGIDMNIVLNLAQELTLPLVSEPVANHKNSGLKSNIYVEQVVLTYSDETFVEHFTMSRTAVEELTSAIGNHLQSVSHHVPLDKKILFTLWMLGKQKTYLSACDLFDIATSTGHGIFVQIVTVLAEMSNSFIVWPSEERLQHSAKEFEENSCGIPGVVGVIDATFVEIKEPVENAVDFEVASSDYAVTTQAVCDHDGRFLDVFVGMPGGINYAAVFRNSPLYNSLTALQNRLLPPEMHIIGSFAYPLLESVLTPFQNNGCLSDAQVLYNDKLNLIIATTALSFARLRAKFCRLKYLDMNDLNLINNTIMACCMLHNFIINVDGQPEDGEMCQESDAIEEVTIVLHELEDYNKGSEKRNHVVSLINL